MTKDYLRSHIVELMPAGSLQRIKGEEYLVFNAFSDLSFMVLPNFSLRELLTKNKKDTYTKLKLEILVELQVLRTKWGSGIQISSSYRSPEYNKSIDGATSSTHIQGWALDTYPSNGDIKGYKDFIKANKKTGGRGLSYDTFVHIDVGPDRVW